MKKGRWGSRTEEDETCVGLEGQVPDQTCRARMRYLVPSATWVDAANHGHSSLDAGMFAGRTYQGIPGIDNANSGCEMHQLQLINDRDIKRT